tara:strand:- start:3362 stop:4114 length:753 start_codon:yes stop_codon:yes gene_type:complete
MLNHRGLKKIGTILYSKSNVYKDPIDTSTGYGNKEMGKEKEMEKNKKPNVVLKQDDSLFFPTEKDSLFWIYYILKNSFDHYQMSETSKFSFEKETKIKCIDVLRQNKKYLTPFRIRNVKDTVEDDLVSSKAISKKTFISLCIVSNINVILVENRKYTKFFCNPEEDIFYIVYAYETPKLHYSVKMLSTNEDKQYIVDNYFECESINSPLKAMSSYKLQELKDIAKRVGASLDTDKKYTKKDIYEKIVATI